ncbi:MAG: hypothetical protein EKK48_10555 [Candidatus Melainabacteria bacterium]|nr:MAG: hypothetical protein EKK48_10555 [Candidatus Melainabacteria bacterium]
MSNGIKLSTNSKLRLIAVVLGLGSLTIANQVLAVLSGSAEGGLLGALVVGVATFAYVCSKGQGATAEYFYPHAGLYKLTAVNALAVVKNALMTKHFDDRQWRQENIDAELGTALFVCKYVDKPNEKVVLERKIQLSVQVRRVEDAVSVRFVYEPVNIGPLERVQPAEFCAQTTAFLESELMAAQEVVFA